jgi:hypothetical protein
MPKLNVNQIDKYLNPKDNGDNRKSKPNRNLRKDNNQNYNKKNDKRRPTSRNQ